MRKVWRGLGVIIGSPQCSLIVGVVGVIWMGSLLEGTTMSIWLSWGYLDWVVGLGFGWGESMLWVCWTELVDVVIWMVNYMGLVWVVSLGLLFVQLGWEWGFDHFCSLSYALSLCIGNHWSCPKEAIGQSWLLASLIDDAQPLSFLVGRHHSGVCWEDVPLCH